MIINYETLEQTYRSHGQETTEAIIESIQKGELKPDDFSIRGLAKAILGQEKVQQMDPRLNNHLVLDRDNVDVIAFSTIVHKIITSKILESYSQDAFIFSKLVDVIPKDTPKDTTNIDVEESIDSAESTRRGFIVPVTSDSIFYDRTGQILLRASEVGEILGLNKEKRLLDVLIGITNNYVWKGTPFNTYNATDVTFNTYSTRGTGVAPDGNWVNQIDDELIDWTDVDAAEQIFSNIVDPNTGESLLTHATTVLVMPAYRHAAHRIFNATEIKYSSGTSEAIAPNPLANYTVVESRLAYRRLLAASIDAASAKKYWFIGDFKKAFSYVEDWPLSVVEAPLSEFGSFGEFGDGIILRFKASEKGEALMKDPRYVVMSTGSKP
ncbi:MAG: hypothetical protein M0R50_08080 [Candidatus Cloacimonetes bacterium]|jgi:hypothetical protein|nr:hypothetical protein [Candidatus Cloacimonadota bacterium]